MKPARMLPLEMHSEMVGVLLTVIFSGLCLHYLHENQRAHIMGSEIMRVGGWAADRFQNQREYNRLKFARRR